MPLVGKTHPSSWTLKSLPDVCQQREVTAVFRGDIPRRWRGYLGSKKVETVTSYRRNITKINVAKITLQRLIFVPVAGVWALTPFGDTTLSSRPHPCESCGDVMKPNVKIWMFYTRGRKQWSSFLPQLILLLVPPFSSCPLPPWQSSANCITLSSASTAAALSKQVLYEQNSTTAKHGPAERENSG